MKGILRKKAKHPKRAKKKMGWKVREGAFKERAKGGLAEGLLRGKAAGLQKITQS